MTTKTRVEISGLDYSGLPPHIQGAAKRYIEHGVEVGGFLTAMISNNLTASFATADETNRERMFDIVSWFYNEAPGPCWGSPEKMTAWMQQQRTPAEPVPELRSDQDAHAKEAQ
jgi:hypothetical protein